MRTEEWMAEWRNKVMRTEEWMAEWRNKGDED